MKRKPVSRKPSKSEQQSYFTLRNHIDLSSHDVTCRLQALYSIISDTEQDIQQLQAKLSQRRVRLAQDQATVLGLEAVLEARR
jgi:hypothetical protein